MKMIAVVALALVAVACAAPQAAVPYKQVEILEYQNDQQPDGAYIFNFKSEDGTSKSEQGELKQALDEENKPRNVVVVRGSYTYTDTEGKPQTVNYYADETGFHAEGDIIPKAEAFAPVRR